MLAVELIAHMFGKCSTTGLHLWPSFLHCVARLTSSSWSSILASQVLGWQICAITPGSLLICLFGCGAGHRTQVSVHSRKGLSLPWSQIPSPCLKIKTFLAQTLRGAPNPAYVVLLGLVALSFPLRIPDPANSHKPLLSPPLSSSPLLSSFYQSPPSL